MAVGRQRAGIRGSGHQGVRASPEQLPGEAGALLCVANFPANTGYAWDFIERLYARVADHLATHGVRTLVAYPAIDEPPRTLANSAARPVVLDLTFDAEQSIAAVTDFIRREGVRAVYLTDRPARSRVFRRLRRAGARWIVVHDHSSGARTPPRGLKRLAKWVLARFPGMSADIVIAVSDYVARRQVEVGLLPRNRVVRVWNGVPLPALHASSSERTRALLGIGADRALVGCACRATAAKGVEHLLRAFDRVMRDERRRARRPALVYIGDGPFMDELRELRDSLPTKADIIFAGYRPDAAAILAGVDLCVVPSVWQDAFPLSVLETMAAGRAVLATAVGGIAEMIEDGVSGVLVPPADDVALANAMAALLDDPHRRRALGEAARRRVAERFAPEDQVSRLTALIEPAFGSPCGARHAPVRYAGSEPGTS